jgi:hypothetical protein
MEKRIKWPPITKLPKGETRTLITQSSCLEKKKDLKVPTKLPQGTTCPWERGFSHGKGD